ncbi:MAG: F0F1 ATP synthase subunit A [Candidatus Nomurabacteria bacterium]|jgi:F-type H+-transporting ATPase subunit a|nr:F0F1 ATP synthase subunit A [Candidatus Nomurabacteria bacterium]
MTGGFLAEAMHISIKAEPILEFAGVKITNSMLMSVAGFLLVIVWLSFIAHKSRQPESAKKGFFTRLGIWCFTGLYNTVREIIPNPKICRIVAPFAISLFFYIALQYYVGILPFVGEAITWNGTPLLRGPNADLNMTFGLAILTIIVIQIMATIKHGFRGNVGRYLRNPLRDPMGFFEGLLELIAEFSRLVALSMRLFGNVFAGEVLLMIVTWLTSFASPLLLPFLYIFEMFVGGIQAYVFFSLTVVFAGLAVSDHGAESSHHKGLTRKELLSDENIKLSKGQRVPATSATGQE